MPHGVSQAQGAARTLAACTGHSSTPALRPVPAWPATCCDRSAPRSKEEGDGWPLGSVSHYQSHFSCCSGEGRPRRQPQPPGGRHTQAPCSASMGTTSACGPLAPQQPSVGWLSLKHRNRSGIITLKGPRPGSGGISEEEPGCVSA